jgi:hypothetical protein
VAKLLEAVGGVAETTVRWNDEGVGLACKMRTDWRCTLEGMPICFDLKTAADPCERAFRYAAEDLGYDRQEALYTDGLEMVGHPVEAFVFGIVGKAPPHLVALYSLDPESVAAARRTNRVLLDRMAEGVASGVWPGLPTAIQRVKLRRRPEFDE